MKKQLIQFLEFLLSRVQGVPSDAQDPPDHSAGNDLAAGLVVKPASGPSFPDVGLAAVFAAPGDAANPPIASNQTADVEPPPGVDPLLWALDQARWRLTRTEELLLNPLPEAIREASLLVEEVGQQALRVRRILDRRSNAIDVQPHGPKIIQFQQQLSRVSRLLEGAKRVQWARIRWVGALVQTYTPGGRARLWNPFPRSWTVEM